MPAISNTLTARNATLADMGRLLETQHDAKLDVVAPSRSMRMVDGMLELDGVGEPTITLDGVTPARGRFRPTATCDDGIAKKLDIPIKYMRLMRERKTSLLDENVNAWLADIPNKRFLVRNLRGTNAEPGIARALLSDQYKFTDNLDVLMSVLAGIQAADVQVDVGRCDLTERNMYVEVRCPEISHYAPRLLQSYRSPFSGATGTDNPLVFAGFIVRNSETGHGAFKIVPRIIVQICDNGMTFTRDAMKEIHLGGQLGDGQIAWSADTRRAMTEAVTKQARDAVRMFLNRDYVQRKITEVERDAGIPVRDVEATLEFVGQQCRFTETERKTILEHFIRGGDVSSGGVLQAVTSAAQTIDDADEAYEMEAQGLRAMSLAASFQR